MTITPLYASVLALIYVALSFRVIGVRRAGRISLGDGGDDELARRIRVHGNFAEYVPFALILMMLMELQGRSLYALHFIGISLLVGRLLHAFGISTRQGMPRVAGMVLTFTALIAGALGNLGLSSLVTWITN